jgi:hypothetical protein
MHANLPPAHQVLAVKNGQTGKIGKRGIDNIIIIAGPADAGVRVKAGKNGVWCNRFLFAPGPYTTGPRATQKQQFSSLSSYVTF